MNPPSVPPRPPFNDALYQALSPLADQMKLKSRLQQVQMKYNAKPAKKVPTNDAANGPQGQVYQ